MASRTDHYTWAELLRDLPAGAAVVVSVLLVCATALIIFYFAEIRTPGKTYTGPVPTNILDCRTVGGTWQPPIPPEIMGHCVTP